MKIEAMQSVGHDSILVPFIIEKVVYVNYRDDAISIR